MTKFLGDHEAEIRAAKQSLNAKSKAEFLTLIPRRVTYTGASAIHGEKRKQIETLFSDFEKSLSKDFPEQFPFSLAACILNLPECPSDWGNFSQTLMLLLSDQGILFPEARPSARDQLSAKDAVSAFDERWSIYREGFWTESELISSAYRSLKREYLVHEVRFLEEGMQSKIRNWLKAFHKPESERIRDEGITSMILTRLEEIADPIEPDWFLRCLRRIFDHQNSRLKNADIDLARECLASGEITKEQLDTGFFWPNKPAAVRDGYGDRILFNLSYALNKLSKICNNLVQTRTQFLSFINHCNDISSEVYSRYKKVLQNQENLKNEFCSDDFLIYNNSHLPDHLMANLLEWYNLSDCIKLENLSHSACGTKVRASRQRTNVSKGRLPKYFQFKWIASESEQLKAEGYATVLKRLFALLHDYYCRRNETDIPRNDNLSESVRNVLAFSLMEIFSIEEDEDDLNNDVPLTIAPVFTYLIFHKYYRVLTQKSLDRISLSILQKASKASVAPQIAEKDLWLYSQLHGIYAEFYGNRYTEQVSKIWNAAFLVYSGYQKWYAMPELLQQIPAFGTSFPISPPFERIPSCLQANRVSLAHGGIIRMSDIPDCFHPIKPGDVGWEAFQYFKHRLRMDCESNEDHWLGRFQHFLQVPYTDSSIQEFLEDCLSHIVREFKSQPKQEIYNRLSKKYGLAEIFKSDTQSAEPYIPNRIKDPGVQCTIVLEYTLRFMLEERCAQRLYNWLTSYIDNKAAVII